MAKGTKDDPIRITDKQKTKLLQCSYPDCGLWLEVTKFESASRARCPEHKGKTVPSFRAAAPEEEDEEEAPVNGALGRLACPFHPDEPMELIRFKESMGFITFKCRISACSCSVEVRPNWGPMVIPDIPERLRPVVEEFNREEDEG